jgi:hypothetical protein
VGFEAAALNDSLTETDAEAQVVPILRPLVTVLTRKLLGVTFEALERECTY